ncbi:hypothetical protein [Paenibacillus brasilensis]|uniref:Uncharacterized protein n=1 Tax=Paenibacillus brasilensis TaxID=128574 RepID=A0ABU0KVB0_9BACL|nr:hypothetical protein [Paenibacillus brasilensis]MDQ0493367.1 hypothetical protein [Paenibacillus brasilensis]
MNHGDMMMRKKLPDGKTVLEKSDLAAHLLLPNGDAVVQFSATIVIT